MCVMNWANYPPLLPKPFIVCWMFTRKWYRPPADPWRCAWCVGFPEQQVVWIHF